MIIPEQTKYFIVFIFRILRPKYVRKRYFREGVTGCKIKLVQIKNQGILDLTSLEKEDWKKINVHVSHLIPSLS